MEKPNTDPLLEKPTCEAVNRTEDRCSVQYISPQETSTPNGRWKSFLRFRSRWKMIIIVANFLILCLTVALLVWYLEAAPKNSKKINSTTEQIRCQPLRHKLCQKYKVPYSYTVNSTFHKMQAETLSTITYYPLIRVKCYRLLPLFLCSMYVPKCIRNEHIVPPCRTLCKEALRKCEFFLGVFSLSWPTDIDCDIFKDSSDPEVCVGHQEILHLQRSRQACKNGFRCDHTRCLPKSWRCDGYQDCKDATDERGCGTCSNGEYFCGGGKCIKEYAVCNGITDCTDGRDERQCLRLNQSLGTENAGRLEVYNRNTQQWLPVCGSGWDSSFMSAKACSILGYRRVNETRLRDEFNPEDRLSSHSKNYKNLPMKRIFSNKVECKGDVTVHLKCQNYECGKASVPSIPSSRIVGGKESTPGSWPWLAALHGGPEEVFFCGGILISPWWVLSAAHCVGNQTNPSGWSIKLGMTRRTSAPFFVHMRGVSQIIKHPDFPSNPFYDDDLALLMLDKPVNFDEFLRPICLPSLNLSLKGYDSCVVTGWGKAMYDDEADYQVVIHQVKVPIVKFKDCFNWYSFHQVNISEKMICAGYLEGEKDACQGDSGGPLLCWEKDHWFVAGIVSWGINCAQPTLPGIYTKVPVYIDWILATTSLNGHPVHIS